MISGRLAPVLSEQSEFTCGDRRKLLGVSGASIFCFVFVANDKNEGAKNEVLNNSSKFEVDFG